MIELQSSRIRVRAKLSTLCSESAYALPSVLLLVTILSLVSVSIVSLQYLQRQLAFLEVAKVKSDFAAESGVAGTLAALNQNGADNSSIVPPRTFTFSDEGEARTEVRPWGGFFLVESLGMFRKVRSQRIALVADRPGREFDKALIFANSSHQLVLTGSSSIKGDVVVGHPGVVTATLRGYQVPKVLPIQGTVAKVQTSRLPSFNLPQLDIEIQTYLSRFTQNLGSAEWLNDLPFFQRGNQSADLGLIRDSVSSVILQGPITLTGKAVRRDNPLAIIVHGQVNIDHNAMIRGLITIIASEDISVHERANIEHAILFSQRQIVLQPRASVVAQLIAPQIVVREGAAALYPSLLYSLPGEQSKISLYDGALVEGLVCVASPQFSTRHEPLVVVSSGAHIRGLLYVKGRVTLDGSVTGTVCAEDFYFYEQPTHYNGWLRSGRIDRTQLPSGFLLPPGHTENRRLEVLDWL